MVKTECKKCGYTWNYNGKLMRRSCPSCGYNWVVKKCIPNHKVVIGLLNLDELNKEWEIDFENWTVETLKLTKFEEEIIEELTDNVLPRHMPTHDWNLPYAEACILALRRLVNKEVA